ncbi:hypothetical protein PV10_07081 [Exophiala mesophila]|uniref:LysM domain-containing protein n=1 Tax=Exophiala mesophila TaxID=212818 RepID=A0A0D1WL26_EXOME|nr:uncharacterized protein PV10_07081 [Exophiala mesophila]KIV89700.1 hypothetical protein PV10_07081 [Exophiala mesophila]
MNNGSLSGLYQSSNNSNSTLRPRGARLISYLGDDNIDSTAVSTSSATLTSIAPTPPRQPSRGVSPNLDLDTPRTARTSKLHGLSSSGSQQSQTTTPVIWEPWSSIQGLASSFLRSESPASTKDKSNAPFKTPAWMRQDRLYSSTNKPALEWGPNFSASAPTHDLIAERKSKLEAKKREALLLAAAADTQDSIGRYKRRDSNGDTSFSISPDSSQDTLVYMHKVTKDDTMAGVVIKYNCQGESFRKVNRFWPNDNIQTRTHVLVPLDACSARGRKVDSPYLSQDLFHPSPLSTPSTVEDPTSGSSTLTSEPISFITPSSEEVTFRHDSWVVLPSFKEPVEVLRVPRRALAYFPRARRKSNSTLATTSPGATPKSSFDTLRHPPTHAAQISASLNASPVRRPALQARLNSGRKRSASTTTSSNSFADSLRGPGGVGTLSGLRTEIARPGPGEDPLNKKFAQYLPDLLAPEDIPRTGFSFRPTPRATPRASVDSSRSTRSNSSGLVDLGGTLEGWVRKIGPKALRERTGTVAKMGELIELETNSEGQELGSQSRSRLRVETGRSSIESSRDSLTPTAIPCTNGPGLSITSATEQAILNERFPMRGRVRNAYETGKK